MFKLKISLKKCYKSFYSGNNLFRNKDVQIKNCSKTFYSIFLFLKLFFAYK
jgi:hypothetical protein